jgi:hypothetical protein
VQPWLECDLFLGFEVSPLFEEQLTQANPYAVTLFIQGEAKSDYLTSVEHDGKKWIGKFAKAPFETEQILLLQSNIYSLVQKLVPSFSSDKAPLHLFPFIRSEYVSS